jgi:hypothetical protein
MRFGTYVAALCLVLLPSVAQADWLFTPSLAYPFGGDTVDRYHPAYGFSFGPIDEEGFGFEADLGVAPRFFDGSREDFTGSGSVLTLMGNLLIAGAGARFNAYVVGGIGYMQMRVTSDGGTFETTTHEIGYNAGGGFFYFLNARVGLRGDVRYIRSFQDGEPSWTRGVDVDLAPSAFDYFRGAVGVTLRFP